jgi:hypothetical protein
LIASHVHLHPLPFLQFVWFDGIYMYRFWLPLCYLLSIVLFVLLWYTCTDSDYLFGILWPLCCLFFIDIHVQILITSLVSSNSSSYMYEPYDENTLWRLLRVSISRLLLRFSLTNSNITSLFRFVTKRTIYRLGIISLAHAPVHVTDFPVVNVHFDDLSSARIWQHKLCATLSANLNMNYRLPIDVMLEFVSENRRSNREILTRSNLQRVFSSYGSYM